LYGARIAKDTSTSSQPGAATTVDALAQLNDELIRFVRLLKASHSHASLVGQDRAALQILFPLLHDGPMRLRDLAEHKGVDQSTISRQAAQLVHNGLIRRDPDPADRRACLMALTDRGRDLCRELVDGRRRSIEHALRGWSGERVDLFLELFRDFNEAVETEQSLAAPNISAGPGGPASRVEKK
jgi:DNA-binding MarR family transcriptional regulator